MYNQIILLGVVVSMIFTEITGLSAGLIVPGYLVLALHSPGRIVTTLIMASVSVLLCRLASQWLILFGRRWFAFLILLTFVLNCVLSAWRLLPFSVIGILMPGILAREIDRQGFFDAFLAIAATTLFTALILLLIGQKLPGV